MKTLPRWLKWMVGLFLSFVFLCVLDNWVYPGKLTVRHNARRTSCLSNLRQISMAFDMYKQDSNGRFPPVSMGSEKGWVDSVYPYLKSKRLFQCPEIGWDEAESRNDYFYNSRLSRTWALRVPQQVVLMGDGVGHSANNYALSELPINWKNDADCPAIRHMSGANYAFADGHVKSVKPDLISTLRPDKQNKSRFTFAVK